MTDDDNYDIERYESAVGWEPNDPYKKLREKVRRETPDWADDPFIVSSGAEIFEQAKKKKPAQLFGDLWNEGELSIMFADTGIGKSILAVQIAESITAGGTSVGCLPMTAAAQKVLYLDFELSVEQFQERYLDVSGERKSPGPFSDNFLRASLDWDGSIPEAHKTLGHFMYWAISKRLFEHDARILIIDNISYLNTANTNANSAFTLMKALKALKTEKNLSILVLAHTPKRRYGSPLAVNDLAGSKMLANFADSIFAIGRSSLDPGLRYIKHIKARSTSLKYDASNVLIFRLDQNYTPRSLSSPPYARSEVAESSSPPYEGGVAPASGDGVVLSRTLAPAGLSPSPLLPISPTSFIGFTFESCGPERPHLIAPYDNANADRATLIARTRELSYQGHSQRAIAAQLNIGLTTVNRYLSES